MLGRVVLLPLSEKVCKRTPLPLLHKSHALAGWSPPRSLSLLCPRRRVSQRSAFESNTTSRKSCRADILVWQLRSFLGNAITVSFMGMFLGPLYPLIMSECAVMIPRHILTGAIGWIAGFGQIGSAAFPFMTVKDLISWGLLLLLKSDHRVPWPRASAFV